MFDYIISIIYPVNFPASLMLAAHLPIAKGFWSSDIFTNAFLPSIVTLSICAGLRQAPISAASSLYILHNRFFRHQEVKELYLFYLLCVLPLLQLDSTFSSLDWMMILVLLPGTLAIFLISTIPSSSSGTSFFNTATM